MFGFSWLFIHHWAAPPDIAHRLHGRILLMSARKNTNPPQQEILMKRLLALVLLAAFSTVSLSACNTVAGMGKDVEKVGEKTQDCSDGKC